MRIVEAIGSKKAVILSQHGLLTVGQTIEAATNWFITVRLRLSVETYYTVTDEEIQLENECRVALAVDAAAAGDPNNKPAVVDPEAAQFTYVTAMKHLH
jgi:ribulose-5-phosphate 4-epimerase/fuculose-1-phosphate aldolase